MPDDNKYLIDVKKLEINKGDLIIVKIPNGIDLNRLDMRKISQFIFERGGVTLFINKDMDIEELNPEEMEKFGWVRKDKDEDS